MEPDHETADDLRWLRALARRLTLGDHDADDLVQETWIHAQARTRSDDDPATKRAWLAAILRNRFRMRRRGDDRRQRREAGYETASDATEAELLVHRQRVLGSLREVLHDLDESDRALLLARYCDDHQAPELAARLGIPSGAVRKRLMRATARVRERLDERWGDRRSWAPAVAFTPALRVPKSTSLLGATLVTITFKKLLIALTVIALATGWWFFRAPDVAVSVDETPTSDGESLGRASIEEPARGALDEASDSVWRGVVMDASKNRPIAGAVVLVMPRLGGAGGLRIPGGGATRPWATSEANGEFAFADLPPGEYALTASAPGFLPVSLDRVSLPTTNLSTVTLAPGGNTIDGYVSDIMGGPIEGTIVRAEALGDTVGPSRRTGIGGLTEDTGHYRLTVPDGTWQVIAGGDDYTEAAQSVSVRGGPGRVDLELVPGAVIEGRVVTLGSSTPVANAAVTYSMYRRIGAGFSAGGSEGASATTDAQGRFRIRGLLPATYTLHAAAPGLTSIEGAVYDVGLAETRSGVEVSLEPAFDVAVRIVETGNETRGVPDVEIILNSTGLDRSWNGSTDAEGRVVLGGIPRGKVSVYLHGEGVITEFLTAPVEVPTEGETVFSVARGVSVRGRVDPLTAGTVAVNQRASVGGLEILFAGARLEQAKANIGADGTFEILAVPDGAWKLVARGETGEIGEMEIDVAGTSLEDLRVAMRPQPSVSGTVVDAAGSPVPGVSVSLRREAGSERGASRRPEHRITTDGSGSFLVLGVAPDRYVVTVHDTMDQELEFLEPPPVVSTTAQPEEVELTLRVVLPQGSVRGRVEDADGQPVADAWVIAIRQGEAGTGATGSRLGDARPHTVTDAQGEFSIAALVDGIYTIDARGHDTVAHGTAADVELGSTVTVRLEQLGGITGRVTASGVPVERFRVSRGMAVSSRGFRSVDGSFTLERLEPGTVDLSITSDLGSAWVKVDVQPGKTEDVDVELGTWGTVTGRLVSYADDTPIAEASIAVTSKAGNRPNSESDRLAAMLGGDSATDAAGRFEMTGVGPGPGTIAFRGSDDAFDSGELGRHAFTLEPGNTLDLGDIRVLPQVTVPRPDRGRLGLSTSLAPPGDRTEEPLPADAQVWVTAAKDAAAKAGIEVGDRLVACDDVELADVGVYTLRSTLNASRIRAGQVVRLRIVPKGATEDRVVSVRADAVPAE